MSTRSRIGVQNADNTVTSIYCHNDGYPEHVGRILAEHYASEQQARALIALGDLSSLGAALAPPDGQAHSFDWRLPGVTVAYARDRGEKNVRAITHSAARWPDSGQQYAYLWTGRAWQTRQVS